MVKSRNFNITKCAIFENMYTIGDAADAQLGNAIAICKCNNRETYFECLNTTIFLL